MAQNKNSRSLGSLKKGDTLYVTKGSNYTEMEIVEVKPRGRCKPCINPNERYPIIGVGGGLHTIAAADKETGEIKKFHLARFEEDQFGQVTWGTGLFANKADAYAQVVKESNRELNYCDREIERCLQKIKDCKARKAEAKKRIRKFTKKSPK